MIMILSSSLLLGSCEREPSDGGPGEDLKTSDDVQFDLRSLRSDQLYMTEKNVKPLSAIGQVPPPGSVIPGPQGKLKALVKELRKGMESVSYGIYVSRHGKSGEVFIAEVVNLYDLIWSTDGSKLAFCEGSILHVADSDGSTRQQIYTGPGGPYPGACFNLQWSATGKEISFNQVEHVSYDNLKNPVEVIITLGKRALSEDFRKDKG